MGDATPKRVKISVRGLAERLGSECRMATLHQDNVAAAEGMDGYSPGTRRSFYLTTDAERVLHPFVFIAPLTPPGPGLVENFTYILRALQGVIGMRMSRPLSLPQRDAFPMFDLLRLRLHRMARRFTARAAAGPHTAPGYPTYDLSNVLQL